MLSITLRSRIVVAAFTVLMGLSFFAQGAASQEKALTPGSAPGTEKERAIKPSKGKALCVGINNFKNYPNDALRGCVNDVNDMTDLLVKWYGIAPQNIVQLKDDQATKANIMQNIKKMVDAAKEGKCDYLVFTLSTHGTQIEDTSKDEPDGADEAFCPYDLAAKNNFWDPAYIIVDDELNALFSQLPKNVVLEVFLDTCHSGTGIKFGDVLQRERRPRLMPQPSREAFERMRGLGGSPKKPVLDKSATNHILWAACRSDQLSNDAEIPYRSNTFHGAFTHYFCKVMNQTQNKLPRREVIQKVRAEMEENGFLSQTPQLEENQ